MTIYLYKKKKETRIKSRYMILFIGQGIKIGDMPIGKSGYATGKEYSKILCFIVNIQ
jgi:hypothetical protein